LGLGDVIKKLDAPLITAFTATASGGVLERVSQILFDGMAHVVRSESDRANIHYFVRRAAAKKKEALFLAKTELKPMIIFCGTRDKCEDMAQELNVFFGKRIAKFYHAGLEKCEKDEVEKWFYNSKDGILCATCAYGMGVDKKDIKTVVHLETPKTAEAYIQEAGRGGRDGSIAKAFLIWSLEDSLLFGKYSDDSREGSMRKFAETNECRRQVLLDALGGEKAYCEGCDLCLKLKKSKADWENVYELVKKRKNFYSEENLNEKTMLMMNKKSRNFSSANIWTHSDTTEIISQLKDSKKIIFRNYFWKNRLMVNKKNDSDFQSG
jgi:ATP-dependent DNA helicase RecQ